jgi:hypothetical protein
MPKAISLEEAWPDRIPK